MPLDPYAFPFILTKSAFHIRGGVIFIVNNNIRNCCFNMCQLTFFSRLSLKINQKHRLESPKAFIAWIQLQYPYIQVMKAKISMYGFLVFILIRYDVVGSKSVLQELCDLKKKNIYIYFFFIIFFWHLLSSIFIYKDYKNNLLPLWCNALGNCFAGLWQLCETPVRKFIFAVSHTPLTCTICILKIMH